MNTNPTEFAKIGRCKGSAVLRPAAQSAALCVTGQTPQSKARP